MFFILTKGSTCKQLAIFGHNILTMAKNVGLPKRYYGITADRPAAYKRIQKHFLKHVVVTLCKLNLDWCNISPVTLVWQSQMFFWSVLVF